MNTHDLSLAEMAVQATGKAVSRYCVSHLGLIERGLSINETLSLVCEDCPIRHILLSSPMDPPCRRHRNKLARIHKKFFDGLTRRASTNARQRRINSRIAKRLAASQEKIDD